MRSIQYRHVWENYASKIQVYFGLIYSLFNPLKILLNLIFIGSFKLP